MFILERGCPKSPKNVYADRKTLLSVAIAIAIDCSKLNQQRNLNNLVMIVNFNVVYS